MAYFDKVKVGNVEVKLYKLQNRGNDYIFVKYHWAGEPKLRSMRRKTAKDDVKARALAKEIATAIYNNRAAHISEIGTGTHVLKSAEDSLSSLGVAVDAACREYAQARQIIGAHGTLLQAAEFFARSQPGKIKPIDTPVAVEEFISDLKSNDVSARHLQDSRSRLRRFSQEFPGPLHEITTPEVQRWLRALEIAPRTRDNFIERIVAFSHWAQTQGYLRKDIKTEADDLRRANPTADIHIFPLKDFRTLLYGAVEHDPRCIHYLAIGTFAFVRPNEMNRMSDTNIRFHHNDIEVADAQAKRTRKKGTHRRLVPMQPCLRAWLEAYPVPKGKLVMAKAHLFVRRLARKLKVPWHHDIMRHTGISHAVAKTGNVDQVALWAGNSRQIIYESYLSQVTPSEAAELYGMMPPAGARPIVQIEAHA